MLNGHIDLTAFDLWHRELDYVVQNDPTRGYNASRSEDLDLYKNISADIYNGVPPSLQQYLDQQFDWLDNKFYAVSKMRPGMILPIHSDKYAYFRSQNTIADNECVRRIIVFLEDWQSGHVSEVDGIPFTLWQQGDWISWTDDTPHMAANLGHTDRYTLQITGIQR